MFDERKIDTNYICTLQIAIILSTIVFNYQMFILLCI